MKCKGKKSICCVLAGRKFLNEDGTIIKGKLSKLFEVWDREMKEVGIKDQIAFGTINAYAQNLCMCDCHKEIKNENS